VTKRERRTPPNFVDLTGQRFLDVFEIDRRKLRTLDPFVVDAFDHRRSNTIAVIVG